ncbi:MAG TPA: hypothetical protein ENK57_14660 [Polyangiaceae bacterium]|nr:hypothetical protein [Polyangiaceae bacterium]
MIRKAPRWVWTLWVLAAVCVVSAMAMVACAEPETHSRPVPDCAVGRPVVDPALLAFLSKAKVVHHRADIAEQEDDLAAAVTALEQLTDGPIPRGSESQPPPEAREVLADTLARMAEIDSRRGRFDEGRAHIARGLELAVEQTHFRGRLKEVLGVVEQRLHDELLEQGDEDGAKEAKERAIVAFQEAIAIQDEVISKSLGELPAAPEPGTP